MQPMYNLSKQCRTPPNDYPSTMLLRRNTDPSYTIQFIFIYFITMIIRVRFLLSIRVRLTLFKQTWDAAPQATP